MKSQPQNFQLGLVIFIFFIATLGGSSINPPIAICPTYDCGDGVEISYPFWFHNDSRLDFCGYPRLKLSCQSGHPTLELPTGTYTVKDISYSRTILTVANLNNLNLSEQNNCPTIRNEVKLDGSGLHFSQGTSFVYFFYDCFSNISVHGQFTVCRHIGANTTTASYYSLRPSFLPKDCLSSQSYPMLETAVNGLNSSNVLRALKEGFELAWCQDVNCIDCESSGGICGFRFTMNGQKNYICICHDGQQGSPNCRRNGLSRTAYFPSRAQVILDRARTCRSTIRKALIVSSPILAATIVLVLCFAYRRKLASLHNRLVFWKNKTEDTQKVEEFLENYESLAPKRYKYSEIKKMTKSFKYKLGQGGYGGVFKGKLVDGRLVAVKVLTESKNNGEDFINEVGTIGRTYHVNIVTLLGFCSEGSKRALIYELMPNGSLEMFIYTERPKTHPLGWKILYQISLGIARGLEYLHRGCSMRILHFDIKPHNILLDQDFCPKISDFGLAKLCSTKESGVSMIGPRGTIGYIAPELCCLNFGHVSYKSDVYSYGMMVLEMVGGRRNADARIDDSSKIYFPLWIYEHIEQKAVMELRGFEDVSEEEIARKMILVGLWCIQTYPADRPSMTRVVEMLEGSIEALQMPPKPSVYSPPTSQA